MFKDITISEEQFKSILNGGSNYHSFNDYFDNIFNIKNSDIWKKIKTFEIGIIVDEFSEYFHLSKTIEHFIKYFDTQNGFLRFKIINNCEYIEVIYLNNKILNNEIINKLSFSGFDLLYQEKYSNNFIFSCFKRGKEDNVIKNIYYIEDRGMQPKVKREGLLLEITENLVINKKTFYYTIPEKDKLEKYENSCFGFNIYEIDFQKLNNPSFCTSFDDSNELYVFNNIPKEIISIKEKHKNHV